jgi:ABC-type transporter Mla subunit MlaD
MVTVKCNRLEAQELQQTVGAIGEAFKDLADTTAELLESGDEPIRIWAGLMDIVDSLKSQADRLQRIASIHKPHHKEY